MDERKGLSLITEETRILWNRVLKKHGRYSYMLAVDGLDQVVLSKGFCQDIAVGQEAVKAKLEELLG